MLLMPLLDEELKERDILHQECVDQVIPALKCLQLLQESIRREANATSDYSSTILCRGASRIKAQRAGRRTLWSRAGGSVDCGTQVGKPPKVFLVIEGASSPSLPRRLHARQAPDEAGVLKGTVLNASVVLIVPTSHWRAHSIFQTHNWPL